MLILTIRTDKPEAELALYDGQNQLAAKTWEAHRILAETLHQQIADTLKGAQYDIKDLSGIVAFQGPGSFTGLRIGLTVANAFADSLKLPIVATQGKDWALAGITKLLSGQNDRVALPEYGSPAHITTPKK